MHIVKKHYNTHAEIQMRRQNVWIANALQSPIRYECWQIEPVMPQTIMISGDAAVDRANINVCLATPLCKVDSWMSNVWWVMGAFQLLANTLVGIWLFVMACKTQVIKLWCNNRVAIIIRWIINDEGIKTWNDDSLCFCYVKRSGSIDDLQKVTGLLPFIKEFSKCLGDKKAFILIKFEQMLIFDCVGSSRL